MQFCCGDSVAMPSTKNCPSNVAQQNRCLLLVLDHSTAAGFRLAAEVGRTSEPARLPQVADDEAVGEAAQERLVPAAVRRRPPEGPQSPPGAAEHAGVVGAELELGVHGDAEDDGCVTGLDGVVSNPYVADSFRTRAEWDDLRLGRVQKQPPPPRASSWMTSDASVVLVFTVSQVDAATMALVSSA